MILFDGIYTLCVLMFLGAQLSLWTGAEASQQDYVALLMCVAMDGYHSLVSYQWSRNGADMTGEIHPLLYTAMVGKYTCKVTNKTTSKERHFVVKGTKSVLSLHNYNNNYYTCMSVCCNK